MQERQSKGTETEGWKEAFSPRGAVATSSRWLPLLNTQSLIPHPQFSFERKDEKAMRRCMSSDYAQLHLASPRPELMGPDYSSTRDAMLPSLTILALAMP